MKRFFKRIVPNSLKKKLVSFAERLGLLLMPMASKTKFTSSLYYLVFRDFRNEHYAVLNGRKAYYKSINDIGRTCALLRRNIHRLEKGLIMRPRRSVFGEGFIQETVDCYSRAIKFPALEDGEKKWATDVLDEYFNVVGITPITERANNDYIASRQEISPAIKLASEFPSNDSKYKPYPYQNLPDSSISFEELKKLFVKRRSVRWYKDRKVPIEEVEKAANIASFAPSACNRQSYKFLFCNDKEKTVAIAKCAGGTTGFAENLPAIIAIVGDLSSYPKERDRHLIYIDGSLAAMQLMLALETLGLSTCSINWPEVSSNERKIRKIIKLQYYERVIMLLAVGYADQTGGIPYSQKKQNQLILEDINL